MSIREQIRQLDRCLCKMTELYGVWAKKHGMSYNKMMVLYALNEEETITQKQISMTWLIPKQTVNTIVKELEKAGYVVFMDAESKRNRELAMTESGRAYANQMLEGLYQAEERAMEALSETERRIFVAANETFNEIFAQEVYRE